MGLHNAPFHQLPGSCGSQHIPPVQDHSSCTGPFLLLLEKRVGCRALPQVKLRQGAELLHMMGIHVPECLVSCAELSSWAAGDTAGYFSPLCE